MSGELTVTAHVDASGPLAGPEAKRVVAEFERRAAQKIADRGVEMLREFPMNKTGRARGGFQSSLKTVSRGQSVVIPGPKIRGVTWAPWLEGTTRRNQTTRFKGYHLFRKTRVRLDREATGIAERELEKYLAEIGGA